MQVDGLSDPRDESQMLHQRYPLARLQRDGSRGRSVPDVQLSGRRDAARGDATFYESNRVLAAYCHGTSALVDLTLSDGSNLVAGKTVTGFANVEEDYSDAFVGQKLMPWRVEDALKEHGTNYIQGGLFKQFVVRDVARAIIAALGA